MNNHSNRFEFLDVLRLIAALSVLIQHTFEKNSTAFYWFSTYCFQLGVYGVTLFFLISGYIIPFSLEKSGSLRKFWIGRIFRLYPLFILSMVVSLLTIYWGIYKIPMPDFKTILANFFMIHRFVGKSNILGAYWTLCLEMLFYIILSIVFIAKFIKHSVLLAVVFLCVSLIIGPLLQGYLHLLSNGWGTTFYFSTMFTGTVFYRFLEKQISQKTFLSLLSFALFVLFCNVFFILYSHDRPELGGDQSFWPVLLSMTASYITFYVFFLFRNYKFPSLLVSMGAISYSLYLVQGSVLATFPTLHNQYLTAGFWISATIAIAYLTYYFVEKPFIAIGRNLIKKINLN